MSAVAHARDLSPDEVIARRDAAHELEQDIKDGIRAGRRALWAVAKALHAFDEQSGYTALGYDTLNEWLADPEIGMTSTTYYRLTGAWRELAVARKVEQKRLDRVDVTKADVVLPSVRKGLVTVEKALNDAEAMGLRDLRDEYIGRRREEAYAPEVNGDVQKPAPVNDGTDMPTWAAPQDGQPTTDLVRLREIAEQDEPEDDGPVQGEVVEAAQEPQEGPLPPSEGAPGTPTLLTDLATVMWRVCEEVAPPRKKHMSGSLRAEVQRVTVAAVEAGALDGVPVWMGPDR